MPTISANNTAGVDEALEIYVHDVGGDRWPPGAVEDLPARRDDESAESWCARVAARVRRLVQECGQYDGDWADGISAEVVKDFDRRLPTNHDHVVTVCVIDAHRLRRAERWIVTTPNPGVYDEENLEE